MLLILGINCAQAQFMDTLHKAFTGHKSFDFRYGGRWSFVNNELVTVQSLKVGVNFGKKLSVGGGYCWLKTDVKTSFNFYDEEKHRDTLLDKTLKLSYFSYYVDYIFYKSKRWQYSIPMQFGMGHTQFQFDYEGSTFKEQKHFIALYEPGINVKFKVLKWMGVDANVGYRIVLKNNHFLSTTFNSPIYSAGVLIYWNEVALALFPKSGYINEKLGPSEW